MLKILKYAAVGCIASLLTREYWFYIFYLLVESTANELYPDNPETLVDVMFSDKVKENAVHKATDDVSKRFGFKKTNCAK